MSDLPPPTPELTEKEKDQVLTDISPMETTNPSSVFDHSPEPKGKGAAKELSPKQLVGFSVVALVVVGLVLFGINKLLDSRLTGSKVTPTPSATASVEPTTTPLGIIEESPTPTASTTPSPTPTPKPTTTPTPTPSPTPTPTPTSSLSMASVAGQDGFWSSNGGGNDTIEIRAGRNDNLMTRGFVGFNLAALPNGSKIQKATLRLYQYKIDGTPYSSGGNLIVDNLDYGSSIDNNDYSLQATSSNIGTLSSNADLGWKEVDVTSAVKNDFSSHTSSQFRLRFSSESQGGGATGDFAYFYSANPGSNTNAPQLVIQYY